MALAAALCAVVYGVVKGLRAHERASVSCRRSIICFDLPSSSRTQGSACKPFGLFGRLVPDRRMDAYAIVIGFDIGEQVTLGLFSCCPLSLMDESGLQGMKKLSIGHCRNSTLRGSLIPWPELPTIAADTVRHPWYWTAAAPASCGLPRP